MHKPKTSYHQVLEGDEVAQVLRASFYQPSAKPVVKRPAAKQPEHYEVICISLYREDLERLDKKVADLKRSGHTKMNRSALIRFALDTADLGALPKAY